MFLDIGALASFIDKDFVARKNLNVVKDAFPTTVEVIDERPLASRKVIEETQRL